MVAEVLKSLRKTKKYNQQQVADKLGITRQAYTNYESGKRVPEVQTLEKLAQLFDVSVDYLLGRSANPEAEMLIKQIDALPEDKKEFFYSMVRGFLKENGM